MKTISLAEWQSRWTTTAPGFDPIRRPPVDEKLQVGDVQDNGWLMYDDGVFIEYGRMWLTPEQRLAAEYYGWRVFAVNLNSRTPWLMVRVPPA